MVFYNRFFLWLEYWIPGRPWIWYSCYVHLKISVPTILKFIGYGTKEIKWWVNWIFEKNIIPEQWNWTTSLKQVQLPKSDLSSDQVHIVSNWTKLMSFTLWTFKELKSQRVKDKNPKIMLLLLRNLQAVWLQFRKTSISIWFYKDCNQSIKMYDIISHSKIGSKLMKIISNRYKLNF